MNANAMMVSDHDLDAAAPARGGSTAARHRARLAATQLSRLDDLILKDIGISRGEILGLADDLARGRIDGTRPIRYRSETYTPVGE